MGYPQSSERGHIARAGRMGSIPLTGGVSDGCLGRPFGATVCARDVESDADSDEPSQFDILWRPPSEEPQWQGSEEQAGTHRGAIMVPLRVPL